MRKACGLENCSAHDFRDTCAAEWQESGMPLAIISRLLGHASSTVTEKCYIKFRDDALRSAQSFMEKSRDVAEYVADV